MCRMLNGNIFLAAIRAHAALEIQASHFLNVEDCSAKAIAEIISRIAIPATMVALVKMHLKIAR